MNTAQLVQMANRISTFFSGFKHSETAVMGMTEHLQKFWEPRMKQALWEHYQNNQNHGLTPLAEQSLVQLMTMAP